ncbi:hypothetical protein HY990_00695 [Candidatus Micrarchaeota archaeon]|nr:hypothetical protein [Candidatus Micrarchaeota archaeon]
MVKLEDIQIKKKNYRFDVRKRFDRVDHYNIINKSPLERLKDQLLPKKSVVRVRSPLTTKSAGIVSEKRTGFDLRIIGVALLVAILLVVGMALYVSSQLSSLTAPSSVVAPTQISSFDFHINSAQALTAAERGSNQKVVSILAQIDHTFINNYSLTISNYDEALPQSAYILTSDRVDATTYSDFLIALRGILGKKGITLNEIGFSQLDRLPGNAFLIVPSGAMPLELLSGPNSIDSLASKGVVIVYLGQPFTRALSNSVIISTPSDVLDVLPFSFNERNVPPSEGISLFQPLYSVVSRGQWTTSYIYGSVGVAKKGDGAIIFFPQTLDRGWQNKDYRAAATDVSRVLLDLPWLIPAGENKSYGVISDSSKSETRNFFSSTIDHSVAGHRIKVAATSATGSVIEKTIFYNSQDAYAGDLFIDQGTSVVPTNISGSSVRMNARLSEPLAQRVSMSLKFVNASFDEVESLSQGQVDVQTESSFDVPINLPKGEYIINLQDDFGKIYASSYLKVVTIDISQEGLGQKPSIYVFRASRDGVSASLKDLVVTVDGGKYGRYSYPFISENQPILVDVGALTSGELLPYGKHEFRFTSASGLDVVSVWDHPEPKSIFREPIFFVTLILAVGVVAIGMFFARPEESRYFLDVPDFPPVSRTKIPISKEVILSIFNKVNENYHWQMTPLSSSEIKNGFKNIYSQGKPIFITDYNVDYLLDQLKGQGLIKEHINYYGLTEWEARAKKPLEYLALLRWIRDLGIENAVPFTLLGESEVADTEVTVVDQVLNIHFYIRDMDVSYLFNRVLSTASKGISVVLFSSPDDKQRALAILNSGSILSVELKLELEGGSIFFLTLEEFQKKVREFKGM